MNFSDCKLSKFEKMDKPVDAWKKACLHEVKAKVTFREGPNGELKPNPENQIMQNLIRGEGEMGERGKEVIVKHRVSIQFIKDALDAELANKYHTKYDEVDMKLVNGGSMIEFTHTWDCGDSIAADTIQKQLSENIDEGNIKSLISTGSNSLQLVEQIDALRREISSSLEDGFQSTAIELSNISRAIDFDDESKGDNEVEEFLNNDNENKDSYFLSI